MDGWGYDVGCVVTVFGPCMILLNLVLCAIQLNLPREPLSITSEIYTTMPRLVYHPQLRVKAFQLLLQLCSLFTPLRRAHNRYHPLDFATQLSQNRLVTRILPHGNFKTSEARMPAVSRNMLEVVEVMCRVLLFVLEATDGVRYVTEVIRCALLVLEVMLSMLSLLGCVSCVTFCMLKAVEGVRYVIEEPEAMRCVLLLGMLEAMDGVRHVLRPLEAMRCRLTPCAGVT